ncbi:MAG: hypothetical protein JNJ80_25640 [Gemmatimonadetes bacterium]|nr:hypothetical protein [Gemmatimonadota bacterium]
MSARFAPPRLIGGYLAVVTAVVVATGCLSVGGPCVHEYRDPVLTIDIVGSPRPPAVDLRDIRIDGRDSGGLALLVAGPSFGATVIGDTLRCAGRCGIGTTEGTYTFATSAPGFRTQLVEVNAKYRDSDGGCPSSNSGSTEYRLMLLPGT